MLYIGLNVDVDEVFSVPRVSKIAQQVRMSCGKSYDIKNGCDLLKREVQDQVLCQIAEDDPELTIISPPWDPFSVLQNLRVKRNTKEWLQKIHEGRVLLRFAMRVAEQRMQAGKHFVFEHPKLAKSWADRAVLKNINPCGGF